MNNSTTRTQPQPACQKSLARENLQYAGTGGVSQNNRSQGFVPAFLDTASGHVYRSRFPDGRPAPVHILSGLPGELFDNNDYSNDQHPVKKTVVSGFILENSFYTREQAAEALQNMH